MSKHMFFIMTKYISSSVRQLPWRLVILVRRYIQTFIRAPSIRGITLSIGIALIVHELSLVWWCAEKLTIIIVIDQFKSSRFAVAPCSLIISLELCASEKNLWVNRPSLEVRGHFHHANI